MSYPLTVSRVAALERSASTSLVDAVSRRALRDRGIEFELLVRAELDAAESGRQT